MGRILAIDPGNIESAFVLMDAETYKPIRFAKRENYDVLAELCATVGIDACVIEWIASYGMAVGRDVFDTCVWIGRFVQVCHERQIPVERIYRRDEKRLLCGNLRAKDTNIRRALIDRFATHDLINGKGTKANPDFFYGFRADVWQAFAVGITYLDSCAESGKKGADKNAT